MEEFDFVIVGAGSSGCVLAARLAERSGVTVCVLEAGPRDYNPLIHIPVGWMKLMRNSKINWLYEAEPSEWTGGRKIGVPRGKVIGGSSSINGNVFNRGAPSDFDHWAQLGNKGWSYEDVLPLFRRMETWLPETKTALRGKTGPLRVTPSDWTHPLCEAFLDSAASIGIPRNLDYNGLSQFGASYTQRTIANGRRQSAATSFLMPALKNNNISLKTNAHVLKLSLKAREITGLIYRQNGKEYSLKARREIILCGGVINSPQLLQLSGIGDPMHLKDIGVEVSHSLTGVGQNLRDHFATRFTYRVKNAKTFNERTRGLAFVNEAAKWALGKSSVLSLPATACYAFAKSSPVIETSDLQITFMPASYKEGVQSQLDICPGMTLAAWQQRPESTGYVRARSSDPFQAPEIQPNYLSSLIDQDVFVAGLRLIRRLVSTEYMQPFCDQETYPGLDVTSDEDLLNTARARGTTAFHMMGTCRMGPKNDESSVVDDRLRVKGLSKLRIADASIMPTMPSANTNATCYMIGEKAADLIQ